MATMPEPAAVPPLLEVNIRRKFYSDREILCGLRLHLAEGEIVSVIGASGCGKSTLLNLIAGLDREFDGEMRLDQVRLQGPTPDIAMIFQEPRLFPWLTVAQNIAFEAGKAGAGDPRVAALLREVGLADFAHALPKSLSGGQAQRVAIARGLFARPRLLLLDEPFSAVDAFTRMRLQKLLVTVARERKLTLLLVTHDIEEALYLSDRILLLDTRPGIPPRTFHISASHRRDRAAPQLSELKAELFAALEAAHAI